MVNSEMIKNELLNVGIRVDSIWDLVNTKKLYPEAIPTLVDLVQKDFVNNKDKEGVIRALTVKEAKGVANKALLAEYKKIPKDQLNVSHEYLIAMTEKIGKKAASLDEISEYKEYIRSINVVPYGWAIGNAFSVIITKDDVDEILPIVLNKENRKSRQMFVLALGKIKVEKSEDVLIKLLDDEDVRSHAIIAIGHLRIKKAKEKIEPFLNHPKPFVRKVAKKALKRIG